MGGIFVSYRRSDSQGEAGRLFDDLVQHFDENTVFMDVSAIEAGRDFRKAIEEGVTKCGVLLVVMGPEWVTAKDEKGARRLDDSGDFVRIETASALRRDIPVIPVLVRNAKMPGADDLPDDLKDLAFRNCIELTHARWRSDIQLLIEALNRLLGEGTPSKAKSGTRRAAGTARAETNELGNVEGARASFPALDASALERVSRELALRIGPIAAIVVKRAAPQCSSVEDLYRKVAEEIDSRPERESFLKQAGMASSSSPDALRSEADARPTPAPMPAPLAPTQALHGSEASTAMKQGSSMKYVLMVAAVGIFLVLLLISPAIRKRVFGSGAAQSVRHQPSEPLQARQIEEKKAPESTPVHERNDKPVPPAGAAARTDQPGSPQRVSVAQEVMQGKLDKKVLPVYPPLARQAHIQGEVVFDADISKQGIVENLRAVSGHPLLLPAAVDAVKQWRYRPYLVNGEPVAVNTKIIVSFTLK